MKRRRPAAAVAAVSAALGLAGALGGCASTSLAPPPPLAGTHWRAEAIDGKPVDAKAQSTLSFADDRRAAGTLGCNRYTTAYTQDGAYLKFDEVASTRMACPAPAMEQEHRFAAALDATRSFRRDGRVLLLIDNAGQVRARLAPAPAR
jgi:putative lipoprotein